MKRILLGGALIAATAAVLPAVDFQRQVRPILSDVCFQCHGPDPGSRMAGLRLDLKEGVFSKRDNGTPVVPGNPAASLIYQRITQQQAALRMPPEYSHKSLTQEQKETIKDWIAEGAPWSEHWAFKAPVRPEPPAVERPEWVRNPIDNFILKRLENEGLEPAPEADRRTLIRRASLDLRGLPPSPAEVDEFVNDKRPDAYEQLVDRLLDSDAYGEHRARYWLDAARYADTHGIHIDNYREMWPYRDWVIRAFNRNMPFDQFTIEQLAGDLLPNPTIDQITATGFHRCNPTTNEAGVIIEEVEAMYAKDRADTTGGVWLGLTVGCATCHDHKFDPILQKDFYALTAFFRNTTQHAMDGNIRDTPPVIPVPSAQDRPRWNEIRSEQRALHDRMDTIAKESNPDFEAWLNSADRRKIDTARFDRTEALSLGFEKHAVVYRDGKRKRLKLSPGVTVGEGPTPERPALHFGDKASVAIKNFRSLSADEPFTIAAWVFVPKSDAGFVVASQSDRKHNDRGWSLSISGRLPNLRLDGGADVPDDDDEEADRQEITIRSGHLEQLEVGQWHHVMFTYDGSRHRTGFTLYLNGKAVLTQGGGGDVQEVKGDIRTDKPLLIGQQNKGYFPGGAVADFRIFRRELSENEAEILANWQSAVSGTAKAPGALSESEREALRLYYLTRVNRDFMAESGRMAQLEKDSRAIRRRSPVTLVMHEREDTKPMAHILYRGQYDQPREEVQPNTPVVLPPMPASYPRNRLGLAKWLMDDDNPLTARVTVNRFWQQVFGTGIVKTSEDFGSQGEAPSHPELLDWLAVEFRESGWDIKHMFRLMLNSAAYRQSAASTDQKIEKDPYNRLLSRGPRFRMDGEMVRDYALAASGLLTEKIGGPSVKPYQPNGVWEAVAMNGSNTRHYRQDDGDKLYRRSLYTFWKRAAPPASMEIFNAPTREVCTLRRERTNTPLQALVTMNDPQFVESARELAQNVEKTAPGNFDAQLDAMAMRLLARRLDEREKSVVKSSYRDFLNYYDSNPAEARELLSTGQAPVEQNLNAAESAALTMVANQLMNLDEVLNK